MNCAIKINAICQIYAFGEISDENIRIYDLKYIEEKDDDIYVHNNDMINILKEFLKKLIYVLPNELHNLIIQYLFLEPNLTLKKIYTKSNEKLWGFPSYSEFVLEHKIVKLEILRVVHNKIIVNLTPVTNDIQFYKFPIKNNNRIYEKYVNNIGIEIIEEYFKIKKIGKRKYKNKKNSVENITNNVLEKEKYEIKSELHDIEDYEIILVRDKNVYIYLIKRSEELIKLFELMYKIINLIKKENEKLNED